MHPGRHFTYDQAQEIRQHIFNGMSMRALAIQYQVSCTTIRNIRDQITYKEIQPISQQWISFDELLEISQLRRKKLKKLLQEKNISVQRINGKYYALKKDTQQYIDAANMIPLQQAAVFVGLTFQRLHQLKDAKRITTLQIGKRYYVNPEQLKVEVDYRKSQNKIK